MNKLCVTQSSHGNLTPRRNEQRLLRNMGIYSVVLELLQVQFFLPQLFTFNITLLQMNFSLYCPL